MYYKKKEKLFIDEIMENPAIGYPPFYMVSGSMIKNDYLHDALRAIHNVDFEHYEEPSSHEDIFRTIDNVGFVLYKEKYVVGFFGERLMYLEQGGWKGLYASRETFTLENWLV